MTQAADGLLSFALSVHPGDPGGSPLVEKRGLNARSAELLTHELRVLRRLSHPNIIELAHRPDSAGDDTPDRLVTFLAGRSTLANRPPTDPVAAVRTAAQLATTLAEIHDIGWSHGALAPEHCVVGADGGIVVCSWRRAAPIPSVDAPAARADVAALVEVISTFVPGDNGSRGTGRELAGVIESARHHTPTARRLATDLAVLLGDRPRPRRRLVTHLGGVRRASRHRGRSRRPTSRHRRPPTRSPVTGVAVRIAVCLAAIAVLLVLGPTGSSSVARTDDLGPAVVIAANLLRWAAAVAAAYGVIVNGTTLAALISRSARLASAAGRLGPSVLRRWATGLTSVGVLGSAIASAASPSAPAVAAPVTTPLDHHPATSSPSTPPAPRPPSLSVASASEAPPAVPPPATVPSPSPTTWVAAPDDDLWHIAERTLTASLDRVPTNHEIGHYWQRLLAANRSHLSDPDQPDLIFPGQVFDLPPLNAP